MRVWYSAPPSWKGYINGTHLDGNFAINEGLEMARSCCSTCAAARHAGGHQISGFTEPQFIQRSGELGRDYHQPEPPTGQQTISMPVSFKEQLRLAA
jgi:phospho-2-dehydro-3-deoxyheptonate aldolase